MARLERPPDIRSESLYDCFQILGPQPNEFRNGQRLFGNQNIGDQNRCNLQVSGQMPGDYYFIVQRWYARTNIPERSDSFDIWAHSVSINLQIGYASLWRLSLRELLDRRPRTDDERPAKLVDGDPWPVTIPCRQNFTAQVDSYSAGALDELRRWLGNHSMFQHPGSGVHPLVWVHLEGIRVPSEIPAEKIIGLLTAISGGYGWIQEGRYNERPQCTWVLPDGDPDEGYWHCKLKDGHTAVHVTEFGRGINDRWFLPCAGDAHTFVGDSCRDCMFPVRTLSSFVMKRWSSERSAKASDPSSCRACGGGGVIETGNNDHPCDCAAGDRAMFNTQYGRETGAQVKARRR